MSVDYVGDSSSGLTASILGAVGSVATAVSIQQNGGYTQPQVPYQSRPVYGAYSPTTNSSSSLLLFVGLAVLAFFGFRAMKG